MSKRALQALFLLVLYSVTTVYSQPELDITFNGTGKIASDIGGAPGGIIEVLVQPDRKIIAVGNTNIGGLIHVVLARYNENGTIDTTFGSNGFVINDLDPNAGTESAGAAALQPDGKILAAGLTAVFVPGPAFFTVARFNPNGSLDTTFGNGGVVQTSVSQSMHNVRGIAVGQDGKIVAAGEFTEGVVTQSLIVRYNPNGSLDGTFGTGGKVTDRRGFNPGDANIPWALAIQPDGKIVTAGAFSQNPSLSGGDVTIVRYNASGGYDAAFVANGRLLIPSPTISEIISAIDIQPDGRIVAVGESGSDYLVMRFNPDGSPDITFDGDGRLTTPVATGVSKANSVIVQPNGKILVSGLSFSAAQGFNAAYYNPDGSLDTSFSVDGKFTLGFDGSFTTRAFGMGMDDLGRVILGGMAHDSKFAIARLYTPEPFPLTITGRTVEPNGTPVRGQKVGLTNQAGETRWAITSAFGFYQFDITSGQTYTVFVRGSKRHSFETLTVGVNESLNDLDLVGEPRESREEPKGLFNIGTKKVSGKE